MTIFKGREANDVRLVNTLLSWRITEENGRKIFSLIEDVHMFILDSQGRRVDDGWQFIRIKVDEIRWLYTPNPLAFNRTKNHGTAILSLARDEATTL